MVYKDINHKDWYSWPHVYVKFSIAAETINLKRQVSDGLEKNNWNTWSFSKSIRKKTNRKMCQRYEEASIGKDFLFLCSNNWQKCDFMISDLPSYRHKQRMPFRKEKPPSWNSLWIATACQVVRVSSWVLSCGSAQGLCAAYGCHLVLLLGNCMLLILLASGRKWTFTQGHHPHAELSPPTHAPLADPHVIKFPRINLSTEGWSVE